MREYLQYPCGRHYRQQRKHRQFGFQRGLRHGPVHPHGQRGHDFRPGGRSDQQLHPHERQAAAFTLALQTNVVIVAAGTAGQVDSSSFVTQADFALARYTSNGTLDATFGSNGETTTAFGTNEAAICGLAIQRKR